VGDMGEEGGVGEGDEGQRVVHQKHVATEANPRQAGHQRVSEKGGAGVEGEGEGVVSSS
jgi:hypothetical protein